MRGRGRIKGGVLAHHKTQTRQGRLSRPCPKSEVFVIVLRVLFETAGDIAIEGCGHALGRDEAPIPVLMEIRQGIGLLDLG